jgi:hypothetical protein
MPEDPMREIGEALSTAIGTEEIALKRKYGNDAYEDLKTRQFAINWLQVGEARLSNDRIEAMTKQLLADEKKMLAKAAFWQALAFMVTVATIVGLAGFVVWVVR